MATCSAFSDINQQNLEFNNYGSWLLLLLINAFKCLAILTEGKAESILETFNLLESSNSQESFLHIQIY